MSPVRSGSVYSRSSVSSVPSLGTATDPESSAKATDRAGPLNSSANLGHSTPVSSGSQRTVVTGGSKTSHLDGSSSSGVKWSSASDLAPKGSSLKGEKNRTPGSKSTDGSAHNTAYSGIPKLAPQVLNAAPGELNVSKIGTFAEPSTVPFSKETVSYPQLHLRGQRSDRDQHMDSTQSVKPSPNEDGEIKTLKLPGVGHRPSILHEHVGSSSRDRRQKEYLGGEKSLAIIKSLLGLFLFPKVTMLDRKVLTGSH